jgi:hypothetical protein
MGLDRGESAHLLTKLCRIPSTEPSATCHLSPKRCWRSYITGAQPSPKKVLLHHSLLVGAYGHTYTSTCQLP